MASSYALAEFLAQFSRFYNQSNTERVLKNLQQQFQQQFAANMAGSLSAVSLASSGIPLQSPFLFPTTVTNTNISPTTNLPLNNGSEDIQATKLQASRQISNQNPILDKTGVPSVSSGSNFLTASLLPTFVPKITNIGPPNATTASRSTKKAQNQEQIVERKDKQQDHTPTVSNTSTEQEPDDEKLVKPTKSTKQSSSHKPRKLKLYTINEKLDIIDYAKVIGNRAAGREFSVAESSIREWRKNEDKLRTQAENNPNNVNQVLEFKHPQIIEIIDSSLVDFINTKKTIIDWYEIGGKAKEIWSDMVNSSIIDVSQFTTTDMQFSMGWVARFMKRNENVIPKISPPIIATNGASSYASDDPQASSMPSKSGLKRRHSETKHAKKSKKTKPTTQKFLESDEQPLDLQVKSRNGLQTDKIHVQCQEPLFQNADRISRRKAIKPRRVDPNSATLLTSHSRPSST